MLQVHVTAHAANILHTVAGGKIFTPSLMKYPTLKEICADAGDKKTWEEFATQGLKNDQHF